MMRRHSRGEDLETREVTVLPSPDSLELVTNMIKLNTWLHCYYMPKPIWHIGWAVPTSSYPLYFVPMVFYTQCK